MGTLWVPMGTFWDLWGPMGSHGDSMGVYKKMSHMSDIGLMLMMEGRGGGAKWVCQNLMPPTQEKKKKIGLQRSP